MNDLKRRLDEALGEVNFTPTADEIINKYRKKRRVFYIKILASSAACLMIVTVALIMSLTNLPKLDKITATSPQVSEAPQPASEATEASETKNEKNYSPTAQTKAVSADLSSNNNSVSPNTSAVPEKSSPKPVEKPERNSEPTEAAKEKPSTSPEKPVQPQEETASPSTQPPTEAQTATEQTATEATTSGKKPMSVKNPLEDNYVIYIYPDKSDEDTFSVVCYSNGFTNSVTVPVTKKNDGTELYCAYIPKDKKVFEIVRRKEVAEFEQAGNAAVSQAFKSAENRGKIFVLKKMEIHSLSAKRHLSGDMFYYYGSGNYGRYPSIAQAIMNDAIFSDGEFPSDTE